MTHGIQANDKDGWPILPGARVAADRGYKATRVVGPHSKACLALSEKYAKDYGRVQLPSDPEKPGGKPVIVQVVDAPCICERETEQYAPTDECVVLRLEPSSKHGVVVVLRDVNTHGTRTKLPSALRVQRGNTKKSALYREMTDASYRAVTRARRKKETA